MPPHVYPLTCHQSCENSSEHNVDVEMNSDKASPFLLSFIENTSGRRFGDATPTNVTME